MELDDRTKRVLKAVVLSYIETAHPVGSRAVIQNSNFGVSSATIRSIMADLGEGGFLSQPHPSAGRVPTEKGYRFYVDTLLDEDGFKNREDEILQQAALLVKHEDMRAILQDTSRLLSDLTHYMGIVTIPKFSATKVKHIEFIRLRKNCVMTISVSEEGFIQNRFFEMLNDLSQKELNRISNYLNTLYKGMSLEDVRQTLMGQIRKMKDLYDQLQRETLELTKQATQNGDQADEGELYLDGTAHMLDLPDFSDSKIMKGLLKAFEKKRVILQLLERHINSEGVQVFIGAENPFLGDHHCSLVVSPYKRGDRILGALGVIGPTRMAYSKVIPLVDMAAKQVSRLLEEST